MKTFKLVGMALLAILMSCSLAACSDDDDEDSGSNNAKVSLVGEWQQTWEKGYEHCPDDPSLNDEWDEMTTITKFFFYTNGTGKEVASYDGMKDETKFSWKLNGRVLTFTYEEDGMRFEAVGKVVELTEDTFKLEVKGEEDGCDCYSLSTYKRVKR